MKKDSIFKLILALIIFITIPAFCTKSIAAESKLQTTITYTVKKGDTLWGLSQKFFDSPWYWPGLWAENTEITNPHWIYPGQKITLYNKKALSDIIEQKKTSVSGAVNQIKKEKTAEKKPSFVFKKINKLPFISQRKIKPEAIIKEGISNQEMFSTTDEIYILANNNQDKFLIGEKYAIYKRPIKVKDPHNKKILIGYQYNLAGTLEILKKEGKLLKAVITNSYRPISVGDLITGFNEISPEIFLAPGVAGLKGKIIKEKENALFLGEKSVGFINSGTADGVQRGQVYTIVKEQEIKLDKKNKVKEIIPFGSFVILDAKEKTAAFLVVKSEKQVPVGAKFISPEKM
ncbi:MAG: hypothetical protein CSB21_02425 [Deltaproteobacteria bacterium]|nr:MAG: hypothetical protein CSB21_02425 [Deltaproteobacteria bacterium]